MASKLRLPIVALALASLVGGLAGSATARPQQTQVIRFLVTGKVVNGEQDYERQPYPTDDWTLGGSDHSSWTIRWRVKAVITPGSVYSPVALNTSMQGSAKGEFHGGYPRPSPQPRAFYECNWGPLAPQAVIRKVQLYLTSIGKKVYVNFGVKTEPASLPKASCTGDAVDNLVSTTVMSGVFTGVESSCNPQTLKTFVPEARLQRRKFAFTYKFHWGPHQSQGESRPCNGFGSPVWSGGAGTWRFTFKRIS